MQKDGANRSLKAFSLPFILYGGTTLILVLFINAKFLKLFSSDGVISHQNIIHIQSVRCILLIVGISLLVSGLIWYHLNKFSQVILKNRTTNLFLLTTPTVYLLFVAEMLLRTNPVPTTLELLEQSPAYDPSAYAQHVLAKKDHDIYYYDDQLNKKLKARIRNGYRGEKFSIEKPKDEIRIFVLGGSHVYDPSAVLNEDWPHLIEKNLHQKGLKNARVINGGCPGHRTMDIIGRLYAEIYLLEPDYVVTCATYNDTKYFRWLSPQKTALRNIPALRKSTHANFPPGKLTRFVEQSQVVLRLKVLFGEIGKGTTKIAADMDALPGGGFLGSVPSYGYDQYKLNLQTIADICKNIKAKPVFFTETRLVAPDNKDPNKVVAGNSPRLTHKSFCEAYSKCDLLIKIVAQEKNAYFFDLAKVNSGKPELFTDIIHLNKLGSQKVAEAAADYLYQLISDHDPKEKD